jgi:putative tricarboxylic transport membrane protein
MSTGWKPSRAVQLVAGTAPGGGLDRVARALAQALEEACVLDMPVDVINVPGDGARRAWTEVIDRHAGDAHVLGISSPNLTTDYLVGVASFEHRRYTPIATLVNEYIAFAAASGSALNSGADLIARLRTEPQHVTVALSTALGNPNHVALAKLARHAGADVGAPQVRVFDSAVDAVADVLQGNADVCAVTAATVLKELAAGHLRVLAISSRERLGGTLASVPTWNEQGVDCVIGAWRGVSGPAELAAEQVQFWTGCMDAAAQQESWRAQLRNMHWSPMLETGAALSEFLAQERAEFVSVLGDLGLLKNGGVRT